MARRKRHTGEEHDNHERWLVSYADFITLLFAFFVTMYAVSRADEKKMGSAFESFQKALGSIIPIAFSHKEPGVFPEKDVPIHFSITPIQGEPVSNNRMALLKTAETIHKEINNSSTLHGANTHFNLADQIKFILEDRGLVIRISERVFFSSGEAFIRPEVKPILNILGQTFEKIPNSIRIEGHTDNVPIQTMRFPSNWELSTERATGIVRYLLNHFKIDPNRLSASGYAEFRPIASNHTPEGKLKNRRVDFVIMNEEEDENEDILHINRGQFNQDNYLISHLK